VEAPPALPVVEEVRMATLSEASRTGKTTVVAFGISGESEKTVTVECEQTTTGGSLSSTRTKKLHVSASPLAFEAERMISTVCPT
jgi:hypothetical protein